MLMPENQQSPESKPRLKGQEKTAWWQRQEGQEDTREKESPAGGDGIRVVGGDGGKLGCPKGQGRKDGHWGWL